MSDRDWYVKIGVSVGAWSGVLLAATYQPHTPVVFGQYSWGQVTLLGLLMCTAVMAECLTDNMVSYCSKKFYHLTVVSPRKQALRRTMSRLTEITSFARTCAQSISEVPSYLVGIFMSCKRMTHRLMSSGPRVS
jgi:hypothetical protein